MMDESRVVVSAQNVSKWFGDQQVLHDVSLDVHAGEVMCIIGPSGAGKSTFLRCINHLETVNAGRIYVNDELVGYREENGKLYELKPKVTAAQRAKLGMVFQHFNLFPHKTVLENLVEAPMQVKRVPRSQAMASAAVLLERVGLKDKAQAYPESLSGGQKQRVAIARALNMKPELMLFDEPTSALDPELVGEVLAVMKDLALEGLTMIVVTHELGFAREVSDSLVFMADGAVVEKGPTRHVLDAPREHRTQNFIAAVV